MSTRSSNKIVKQNKSSVLKICREIANSTLGYLMVSADIRIIRPMDICENSIGDESVFIPTACFNGDLKSVKNIYQKISSESDFTTKSNLNRNLVQGFNLASQRNNIDTVNWMLENKVIPEYLLVDCLINAFKNSCINGSLEVAKQLLVLLLEKRDNPLIILPDLEEKLDPSTLKKINVNELFVDVCRYGKLEMAKFLDLKFKIDFAYDKETVDDSTAFEMACMYGHLPVAKWLYSTKKIDINAYEGNAFNSACGNGQYDMAVWMYSLEEINITNGCNYLQEAFLYSMINGHFRVAKWLHSTGKFDIHQNDDQLFPLVCAGGHMEIIQWFYSLDNFELKKNDNDYYSFVMVCANGHLHVAQWLYYTFNLTIKDNRPLVAAYQFDHIELIKWLCSLMN